MSACAVALTSGAQGLVGLRRDMSVMAVQVGHRRHAVVTEGEAERPGWHRASPFFRGRSVVTSQVLVPQRHVDENSQKMHVSRSYFAARNAQLFGASFTDGRI